MTTLRLQRLGTLMRPDPANPFQAEGVLNPAAARARDGQLYLFPRYVAKGNVSRIGIVRVQFDAAGDPVGVEPVGIALAPETDYETAPDGRGGCEDPRVTYVEPLGQYVMTYTALSEHGPRIAIAHSDNLLIWRRIGLAQFSAYHDVQLQGVDNKDAGFFPTLIDDPHDRPSLAMLHRPLFPGTRPEEMANPKSATPPQPDLQTIWISYWHWHGEHSLEAPAGHRFVSHRPLALPEFAWEKLKIGVGTPPVLCRHGWLIIYHGVQEAPGSQLGHCKYLYSAGLMILDRDRPHHIIYRSPEPVLFPNQPDELLGTVDGVVFPTGIDRRDDIGQPQRFDIYYGMADDRIGVATLTLPDTLPDMAHPHPHPHPVFTLKFKDITRRRG